MQPKQWICITEISQQQHLSWPHAPAAAKHLSLAMGQPQQRPNHLCKPCCHSFAQRLWKTCHVCPSLSHNKQILVQLTGMTKWGKQMRPILPNQNCTQLNRWFTYHCRTTVITVIMTSCMDDCMDSNFMLRPQKMQQIWTCTSFAFQHVYMSYV